MRYLAYLVPGLLAILSGCDSSNQDREAYQECLRPVEALNSQFAKFKEDYRSSDTSPSAIYKEIGVQTETIKKHADVLRTCARRRVYPARLIGEAETLSYLALQTLETAGHERLNESRDEPTSGLLELTIDRGINISEELLETLSQK